MILCDAVIQHVWILIERVYRMGWLQHTSSFFTCVRRSDSLEKAARREDTGARECEGGDAGERGRY